MSVKSRSNLPWLAAAAATCLAAGAPPALAGDTMEDDKDTAQVADEDDRDLLGAHLSDAERQAFAKQTVLTLSGATKKLLTLIQQATSAKDMLLLNCLNEKLGALRGLHKVAEDANFGLKEALARQNLDLQEHNFRKVAIARQQGLSVAAEATACVSQGGSLHGGGSIVTVTVEGDGEGGLSDFSAASETATRPPDTSPLD